MSINVGSKRFLTNKVDRSVTGLIAGQQCIGPFHTPLSDYSITAFSMMDTRGTACSIGEQPIKGLLNIDSMVEMTIGEMLTNLVFVGASKDPSVVLANVEVEALCKIVRASGETTM